MRSSLVRPPKPGPMRILKTIAVFVPNPRMTPVTAPSKPARIEPTAMMVPVPMMTPRTVRNERILFSRSVASARPITESISFIPRTSRRLRAQRDDRVETGRSSRRVDAEEKAHHRRQRYPDQDRVQRHHHGHRREVAHDHGHQPGDRNADEPAAGGEHGRFDQKLVEDITPPRAHRLPHADLARALAH